MNFNRRFFVGNAEVQSAEFLSYDRFCIYTCKSLVASASRVWGMGCFLMKELFRSKKGVFFNGVAIDELLKHIFAWWHQMGTSD